MLTPAEIERQKNILNRKFRSFYPGSAKTESERAQDFEKLTDRFIDFLRTKGGVGFTASDVIASRLIKLHHWTLGESRAIRRQDWPVALTDDWNAFLESLESRDRDYMLAWQFEHEIFVRHLDWNQEFNEN